MFWTEHLDLSFVTCKIFGLSSLSGKIQDLHLRGQDKDILTLTLLDFVVFLTSYI